MTVQLNHIIIPSRDKVRASHFLATILGVDPPRQVSHFMAVQVANGVTLDYDNADDFSSQHCAFLVGNDDFDAIFDRVCAASITYYADPSHAYSGEINARNDGRGFYFADPDGHNMEVFTVVPLA